MKRFVLPPHIAWPLFVVLILLVGVGGAFAMMIASQLDGGVQVVEDYYRKAVDWDATAARRAASEALGWSVAVAVQPPDAATARQRVDLTVRDPEGRPVSGLTGTLTLRRPHLAAAVAERPLEAVPDQAGVYAVEAPLMRPGLWDFELLAQRDSLVFIQTLRRSVGE